jgi:hypothetical protein
MRPTSATNPHTAPAGAAISTLRSPSIRTPE